MDKPFLFLYMSLCNLGKSSITCVLRCVLFSNGLKVFLYWEKPLLQKTNLLLFEQVLDLFFWSRQEASLFLFVWLGECMSSALLGLSGLGKERRLKSIPTFLFLKNNCHISLYFLIFLSLCVSFFFFFWLFWFWYSVYKFMCEYNTGLLLWQVAPVLWNATALEKPRMKEHQCKRVRYGLSESKHNLNTLDSEQTVSSWQVRNQRCLNMQVQVFKHGPHRLGEQQSSETVKTVRVKLCLNWVDNLESPGAPHTLHGPTYAV